MKKELKPQDIDEIVRLYENRVPYRDIAERFDIHVKTVYHHTKLMERFEPEAYKKYLDAYREDLARKKGLKSFAEYQKILREKRQNRNANKEFSNLLNEKLSTLGKGGKSNFARYLEISKKTITDYSKAQSLPSRNLWPKIAEYLEIELNELERILNLQD